MSVRAGEWRVELPATLEAVEQFCVEFRRWRADVCAGLDGFSAELLLREALTNAVRHGGEGSARQWIRCVLRPKRGRVVIGIADEGAGFDWRAAWDHQSDISEAGGRGMEIFRKYASSVRFNPKGNAVTLVKRF